MSKDTAHLQPRERGKFIKTEKIDYNTALILLDHAIKGREDYVYDEKTTEDGVGERCRNWNTEGDKPSCLIGHILYDWGVPKEELIEKNFRGIYEFSEYVQNSNVVRFLAEVQAAQDEGKTWAEAVSRGRAYAQAWGIESEGIDDNPQ